MGLGRGETGGVPVLVFLLSKLAAYPPPVNTPIVYSLSTIFNFLSVQSMSGKTSPLLSGFSHCLCVEGWLDNVT